MKKIIGNIFFFLLCGILIFGVLSQFGVLPFRITYFLTGSMEPIYAPGDLAIIYTGNNAAVKTGDVVLFHANGVPVIHRIKSIENGQITTQGDANNVADQQKITRVDGKLLFTIPKLGYFFDYFQVIIQGFVKMISPG
jgi:signal peptidase I